MNGRRRVLGGLVVAMAVFGQACADVGPRDDARSVGDEQPADPASPSTPGDSASPSNPSNPSNPSDPPPPEPGPPGFACPAGSSATGKLPNGTVGGELTFPNPTLRNISVHWLIDGDDDGDGQVGVHYRVEGATSWKEGMPLRRVPGGATEEGFTFPNRHAGSIFDLEPGTTYEVELMLLDPDGGCEVRTSKVTTRPVPAPMAGAPVKAVTPATFSSVAGSAMPGDVLELAPGNYAGFTFKRDGAPGKPIVIRAKGAREGVVIGGNVSFDGRSHVHLVGVTVDGTVRFYGSKDMAFMRNAVNAPSADGFVSWGDVPSEDAYIADNTILGTTDWSEAALGVSGDNIGEGVRVMGPGHVIEHNYVKGFRDGISLVERANVDQWSIDILDNDVEWAADDGIEADFCQHNCRVMRNRITNTFMAISSQPSIGGPTYFVRNAIYNAILHGFKLHRGSVGDVILHNTVVKSGDAFSVNSGMIHERQYVRNNLFIGGPGGTYNGYSTGSGRVLQLGYAGPTGDYDYDGYGSTTGSFKGQIGSTSFSSLVELQTKTTEKHAVQVGLDVFAAPVTYPATPFPARPAADLRIGPGSAAVDKGLALPNVNDGYAGTAPDLGCYELGAPVPAYGPR